MSEPGAEDMKKMLDEQRRVNAAILKRLAALEKNDDGREDASDDKEFEDPKEFEEDGKEYEEYDLEAEGALDRLVQHEEAGERAWDMFPKKSITPSKPEAVKVMNSLKHGPTPDVVRQLVEELPNYEGIPQLLRGKSGPLMLGQRRAQGIMALCLAGLDRTLNSDDALTRVAALARTQFAELERARKVEAVRGRTSVLEPLPHQAPPLLTKEERTAFEKTTRGGPPKRNFTPRPSPYPPRIFRGGQLRGRPTRPTRGRGRRAA